ncbi:MAG: hypothetical protein JF595_04655 [Sphingomonadales bacterium]|nr:hypothetical protein [Sphingomonadales bacterium]
MSKEAPSHKSSELERFGLYLRYGLIADPAPAEPDECKFNPYHYPDDGRFTFAPGGAGWRRGRIVPSRQP